MSSMLPLALALRDTDAVRQRVQALRDNERRCRLRGYRASCTCARDAYEVRLLRAGVAPHVAGRLADSAFRRVPEETCCEPARH